jgi:hypothetical protein
MLLERHAMTCIACRARIDALRDENEVLRSALKDADDLAPIPRFAPPPRPRDFVVLIASVVLIGVFSRTFWSTVAAAIPTELSWLNPFESGVLFERATEIVKFIVFEGTAMWTAAFNFIGAALVVAFVFWLAFSAARQRAFIGRRLRCWRSSSPHYLRSARRTKSGAARPASRWRPTRRSTIRCSPWGKP